MSFSEHQIIEMTPLKDIPLWEQVDTNKHTKMEEEELFHSAKNTRIPQGSSTFGSTIEN